MELGAKQKKHSFVDLAEVQLQQKTLYCAGLDPHAFPGKNDEIYGVVNNEDDPDYNFYLQMAILSGIVDKKVLRLYAGRLAAVEKFLRYIIKTLVCICNIRVFKPQYAFYEQFGPAGIFMLMRIRDFIKRLEIEKGIRLICLLDCKRGDIATTQSAAFLGLMDNLLKDWDINFAPFDFDIINVTPWMGKDVMVIQDEKGNLLRGYELMKNGKGIIGVSKSSNPSGPDYQELIFSDSIWRTTVQMKHVIDSYRWTQDFGLEYDGLSTIGLVVGSTHDCDGSIRRMFPTTTMLVPGFGAQKGKFSRIMPELISEGKWNGLGAIFSASRGTLYAFLEENGGSGNVENLETDLATAIAGFRANEEKAYQLPQVVDAGIVYPFS